MLKEKKRALVLFVIALVLCFAGSLGANLVQSGGGSINVQNYNNKPLAQVAETIAVNNTAGNKNITATFTSSTTEKMTYKVLVPKNATPENPAPAVVMMHGGLSNKDTTAPIYIELARRGFVVIAFDAMGHGKTDKGGGRTHPQYHGHGGDGGVSNEHALCG